MQAMHAELARSVGELRMDEMDKPYFIAYTVRDTERLGAAASFGALLPSSEGRSRRLSVEVRVGDASFDNTNFRSMAAFSSGIGGGRALPLKDNVVEIRRQIWLATDAAYKQALQQLGRQARRPAERDPNRGTRRPCPPGAFHLHRGTETKRPGLGTTSKPFPGSYPACSGKCRTSRIPRSAQPATYQHTYYVNSEGSSFIRNDPSASVIVRGPGASRRRHDPARLRDRERSRVGRDQRPGRSGQRGQGDGQGDQRAEWGAPNLPDRLHRPGAVRRPGRSRTVRPGSGAPVHRHAHAGHREPVLELHGAGPETLFSTSLAPASCRGS